MSLPCSILSFYSIVLFFLSSSCLQPLQTCSDHVRRVVQSRVALVVTPLQVCFELDLRRWANRDRHDGPFMCGAVTLHTRYLQVGDVVAARCGCSTGRCVATCPKSLCGVCAQGRLRLGPANTRDGKFQRVGAIGQILLHSIAIHRR